MGNEGGVRPVSFIFPPAEGSEPLGSSGRGDRDSAGTLQEPGEEAGE